MNRCHEAPQRVYQQGPTIPHKQIFDPARVKTPQRGARHRGEHERAEYIQNATPEDVAEQ